MDTESRSWLEREYLFIDVISTFLRAIRAGIISVHHGAVLLAHYGRLGVAFDSCVKVVVDVLREEGLTAGNGEIIVTVATKAIQEVCYQVSFQISCTDVCDFLRHSLLFSMVTSRTNTKRFNLQNFSRVVMLFAAPNWPFLNVWTRSSSYKFRQICWAGSLND